METLFSCFSSERIHKTGVDGTILTEAKYINLSLHYLEQVCGKSNVSIIFNPVTVQLTMAGIVTMIRHYLSLCNFSIRNRSISSIQQVIVALSEKSRTHIPYRNSVLTSVLRDRWEFLAKVESVLSFYRKGFCESSRTMQNILCLAAWEETVERQ